MGSFRFGDALADGVGEPLGVADSEHMENITQFRARDIRENVADDEGNACGETFQKDVREPLVKRWKQCEVKGGQKDGEMLDSSTEENAVLDAVLARKILQERFFWSVAAEHEFQ